MEPSSSVLSSAPSTLREQNLSRILRFTTKGRQHGKVRAQDPGGGAGATVAGGVVGRVPWLLQRVDVPGVLRTGLRAVGAERPAHRVRDAGGGTAVTDLEPPPGPSVLIPCSVSYTHLT